MKCPRRAENLVSEHMFPGEDTWREDDTCSYCGSLNPDTLISRIEVGDVELGPTDKNYKLYVTNKDGPAFKQTYRTDSDHSNDQSKWVYVTREVDHSKFYFQHFSLDQRKRFVELLNAHKAHIGYPGHFYNLPFFVVVEP